MRLIAGEGHRQNHADALGEGQRAFDEAHGQPPSLPEWRVAHDHARALGRGPEEEVVLGDGIVPRLKVEPYPFAFGEEVEEGAGSCRRLDKARVVGNLNRIVEKAQTFCGNVGPCEELVGHGVMPSRMWVSSRMGFIPGPRSRQGGAGVGLGLGGRGGRARRGRALLRGRRGLGTPRRRWRRRGTPHRSPATRTP